MDRAKPCEDAVEHVVGLAALEQLALFDAPQKRRPKETLHHHERCARCGAAEVEHLKRVGVIHRDGCARLRFKTRVILTQDLDRNLAPEGGVAASMHDTKRATTQGLSELVTTREKKTLRMVYGCVGQRHPKDSTSDPHAACSQHAGAFLGHAKHPQPV